MAGVCVRLGSIRPSAAVVGCWRPYLGHGPPDPRPSEHTRHLLDRQIDCTPIAALVRQLPHVPTDLTRVELNLVGRLASSPAVAERQQAGEAHRGESSSARGRDAGVRQNGAEGAGKAEERENDIELFCICL